MLKLKFNEDGLIPAIIQDKKSKKVLMLAYMNDIAYKKTLKTRKTWFYSRSRNKLWMKGEKSGNIQIVKEIFIDCDMDTLLITVEPKGPACHKGYDCCFYRTEKGKITEKRIFDPKKVYKKQVEIKSINKNKTKNT